MNINFNNKRVLVTGGTYGIGRATVESFVSEGARVAVCARSQDILSEMQARHGKNLLTRSVDLMDIQSLQGFVKEVCERWGGMDALVYNPPHSTKVPIDELSLDDWQTSYEAIYKGMLAATAAVLPFMIKQKNGSVVVVSSIAAIEPISNMPPSSVFRSGLAAWLKLMAQEYGPSGIRFNAVMPGYTRTPAVEKLLSKKSILNHTSSEDEANALSKSIPLRRLGRPEDTAQAILFLSSGLAAYITGTTLLVDGGFTKGV